MTLLHIQNDVGNARTEDCEVAKRDCIFRSELEYQNEQRDKDTTSANPPRGCHLPVMMVVVMMVIGGDGVGDVRMSDGNV